MTRIKALSKWISVLVIVALLLGATPGGTGRPVQAASTSIVISQAYGGGGGSTGTYKYDYVELHNVSDAPVSLTGMSLQYGSATGNFGSSSSNIAALSGSIPAGGYYLVQLGTAGTGGADLPVTADATGGLAMSGTSGKVALANITTSLGCGSAPCSLPDSRIIDLVGYGTANNYEGSAAVSTLSSTSAAIRAGEGCTDTDNNAADFSVGTPAPRNSGSPTHSCSGSGNQPVVLTCGAPLAITAGTPATRDVTGRDADGVVDDITLTSVNPTPTAGSITRSAFTPAGEVGGTATATISVDALVPVGNYSALLTGSNADTEEQTGTCTLSINVNPPPTPIHDIQGSGNTSPLVGQAVTAEGVVHTVLGNGFYMQQPDATADADPLTSEGVFVFTNTLPVVSPGNLVRVTGTVVEYRSSSRARDLTLTEISSTTVSLIGLGAMPMPVVINDRPDTAIWPDGMITYEALEGMLVQVDTPIVVGPTNSYGELVVVGPADGSHTQAGGNILTLSLGGEDVDYNPERIMVDDEARAGGGSSARINNPMVNVKVGQHATGPIIGALDYQFSNYRIQADMVVGNVLATANPNAGPISNLRPALPFEARISTFNLENLFDCVDDPAKSDDVSTAATLETKLAKLARVFQQELHNPEILIVEETENSAVLNGDANGFVPGCPTVKALLPRIPGNWQAVSLNASDGRSIEVGFIFNKDRAKLIDYKLGTSIIPDPAGLFDGSSVYSSGREPLVGYFELDGLPVVLIGNHLKSKGGSSYIGSNADTAGDDPLYGLQWPPIRWTEGLRHQQADYVRALVDHILADNPAANILVAGDMNDMPFAEPGEGLDTVGRIKASPTDPLTNLIDSIPADERYTYVFEGNSQVLDHILVNGSLRQRVTGQGVAHFNANFPESFGTSSPNFRTSDHDPVMAYFCADAVAPTLQVELSHETVFPATGKYVGVRATVMRLADNSKIKPSFRLVSVTSNQPDLTTTRGDLPNDIVIVNDSLVKIRAERLGADRVYTFTYESTDVCGNVTTVVKTVTILKNAPNRRVAN